MSGTRDTEMAVGCWQPQFRSPILDNIIHFIFLISLNEFQSLQSLRRRAHVPDGSVGRTPQDLGGALPFSGNTRMHQEDQGYVLVGYLIKKIPMFLKKKTDFILVCRYNWQSYNYEKYNLPQNQLPPGQLVLYPIQVQFVSQSLMENYLKNSFCHMPP